MTKDEEIKQMLEDKYNLPAYVINAITSTPFRMIKEAMNEEEFKCVLVPYFAKFYVSDYRKKKYSNLKERRLERKKEIAKIHEERKLENERDHNRVQEPDMEEGSNRDPSYQEKEDM